MQIKLYTRLILLFVLLLIATIACALMLDRYERAQGEQLRKNALDELRTFHEKIVTMHGERVQSFVLDYTFWDEMVRFIVTHDRAWARQNIDSGLPNYKADAAWVFDPDARLIYSVNSLIAPRDLNFPLSREKTLHLFLNGRKCHFFAETSCGLMVFYGATVHPTNDPERKTAPRGYFLIGCVVNKEQIDTVAHLTDSSISIVPLYRELPSLKGSDENTSTISFIEPLPGWDGRPVRSLVVTFDSKLLHDNVLARHKHFFFIVLFQLAFMGIISFFIFAWVIRPLRQISRSLDEGDSSIIKKLSHSGTELGHVARMIKRYFEQKRELAREIGGHQKAEEEQQKKTASNRRSTTGR